MLVLAVDLVLVVVSFNRRESGERGEKTTGDEAKKKETHERLKPLITCLLIFFLKFFLEKQKNKRCVATTITTIVIPELEIL